MIDRKIFYGSLFILNLFLAVLMSCLTAAAQPSNEPRSPAGPAEPTVEKKENREGEAADLSAVVHTARGGQKTGALALTITSIETNVIENGAPRKKSITLSAVDSIEITRWRGIERRKNEFSFYPEQYRIIMTDKTERVSVGNIPALNRMVLKDPKGARPVYSYFFEYRDGNKWRNSGEADIRFPETNPPAGVVVRIEFIRVKIPNILEKFFQK